MDMIDPTKTPVFPEKDDILKLKLFLSIYDELEETSIMKLINTCIWLFEVVDRMEEHDDWWFINAPRDLKDKYMLEVCGIPKEEMDKKIESLNIKVKEIIKDLRKE